MSGPRRPTVVLAGIVGRYPVGGVTWCALHYVAGFQRLGYDVFYLEDTGQCGYDPLSNGISKDPAYAVRYIRKSLALVGLERSWTYVDHRGRYHGCDRSLVTEVCANAEVMVNLSGGCWFARPEYDGPRKVFIDTDPGFTQQGLGDAAPGWYRDFFASQDTLFTFALNAGQPGCRLPATPFRWHPTVQPLALEFWPVTEAPPRAPYTTILSWRIENFGMSKGKGGDVLRMLDLPARSGQAIRLAIAGQAPRDLLQTHGWDLIDAVATTIDPAAYQAFIQTSRAELGFAKAMYVETRSGWFSDRTQCYLATGRPALVRDTGFGDVLPSGEGVLTFSTEDELLAGMERIESDYAHHSRRAREIAEECFAADRVVARLLDTAGLR
jgi:hypothetical protein